MKGANEERWKQLCAQAAAEQDPKKLAVLIKEISRLLDEKFARLSKNPPETNSQAQPPSRKLPGS